MNVNPLPTDAFMPDTFMPTAAIGGGGGGGGGLSLDVGNMFNDNGSNFDMFRMP